jgi:hypothetical protein
VQRSWSRGRVRRGEEKSQRRTCSTRAPPPSSPRDCNLGKRIWLVPTFFYKPVSYLLSMTKLIPDFSPQSTMTICAVPRAQGAGRPA